MGVQRRSILTKLTCHLAAAHRLRQSLTRGDARANAVEAILDREGNVLHAEGEARAKPALARLKSSAHAIARSRGALRSLDPRQAVQELKGLIASRWTLVDVSETAGKKYLVARQNEPRIQGDKGLTDREQDVVALAALGQHNKLIAYNLGIAASTVSCAHGSRHAQVGSQLQERNCSPTDRSQKAQAWRVNRGIQFCPAPHECHCSRRCRRFRGS